MCMYICSMYICYKEIKDMEKNISVVYLILYISINIIYSTIPFASNEYHSPSNQASDTCQTPAPLWRRLSLIYPFYFIIKCYENQYLSFPQFEFSFSISFPFAFECMYTTKPTPFSYVHEIKWLNDLLNTNMITSRLEFVSYLKDVNWLCILK